MEITSWYGAKVHRAVSFTNFQGTAAGAGSGNISVASAKMITNSAGPLRLDSGSPGSSNAIVGPDLISMDLRSLILNNDGWMAGVRSGTEAYTVVGSSRAYKNATEVFVVSSGTRCACVTGHNIRVNDSQYGDAWAKLCDCTTKQHGMVCWCDCHSGQSGRH
jgi:hypothetical protein